MKHVLLLALSLLMAFSAQAQVTGGTVKGKASDAEGAPLGFATVIVRRAADSVMVKAGYTDDAGNYDIRPVPPGEVLVEVSLQGYKKTWTGPVTVTDGQETRVPDLTVELLGVEQKAVVIETERPMVTVQPDKTVFNVQGTANAVGENAFNLLRKAPGVVVDNNDNVMLLGKAGVRIYIDGKPSPLGPADLANFLKTVQSDQIESFEIITNPSSKYDAEGNAGIINIRFKKDSNLGANATVSLDYSAWIHHRLSGTVSANYRTKRVNLFGSYTAGVGASQNFMHFYREQLSYNFESNTIMTRWYRNHNFRGGADFYLNKKHSIGFIASGFLNGGENDNDTRNEIGDLNGDTLTSVLTSLTHSDSRRDNLNGNVNYRYDNAKGTTLNVDLDYGTFRNTNLTYQPNAYRDPVNEIIYAENNYRMNTPTNIDIYTAKLDYERPLLKGKLGTGAKVSYVQTANTFDFYNVLSTGDVLDSTRSNTFNYTENVNAVYANYTRQIQKWGIQAGLRMEHTHSLGDLIAFVSTSNARVERDYLNLFPSAGITYAVNKMNSLRLTYSRRIDRPRYENLNPFQQKMDELSYMAGNPFLRPQYTHAVEIGHTYAYVLNTTLSHSLTTDYFTNLTDTIESVRTFMTLKNLGTRNVTTFSVSCPVPVQKWWNTFTNASFSRSQNRADFGEGKIIDLTRYTFSVFHQSTFSLPAKFQIQYSIMYNSPGIWGANFATRKFWGMELGLMKKVFQDRGLIKAGMSDIFFTQQWSGEQRFGGLYSQANGGWESRQVKLSYTHTFGNASMKTKRRKTGLEEEGKRAGEGGGMMGQ